MNEIITVNGAKYTTKNVTTGINTISFTLAEPAADAEDVFKNAKTLAVEDGKGTPYGEYQDVEFKSLTKSADESVTITMHILTKEEKQIRELQAGQTEFRATQAEQDEAIAEILYGGEV